jgi:hypothetical protein
MSPKISYFPFTWNLLPVLHLDSRLGIRKNGTNPLTNLTACCPNLVKCIEYNEIKLIKTYSNLDCYTS